jgi:hypothetical protein
VRASPRGWEPCIEWGVEGDQRKTWEASVLRLPCLESSKEVGMIQAWTPGLLLCNCGWQLATLRWAQGLSADPRFWEQMYLGSRLSTQPGSTHVPTGGQPLGT